MNANNQSSEMNLDTDSDPDLFLKLPPILSFFFEKKISEPITIFLISFQRLVVSTVNLLLA